MSILESLNIPRSGSARGRRFVIITAASDQAVIRIHDRRPLLMTPEHSTEWLDPDLPPTRRKSRKCRVSRPENLSGSLLARPWATLETTDQNS
ncbi:SOS response-associated peptidase family protein [Pseudomonas antarctica]|uniref:SOS response-associated peptidase family protein n=1 Tax=Pseudomonas antarctica TaxID=219572 RepID=UPI003F75481E